MSTTGNNYSMPATEMSDAVVALDLDTRQHRLVAAGPAERRLQLGVRVDAQGPQLS